MTAPPRCDNPYRLRPPAVTPRLTLFGAAAAAALAGAFIAYTLHADEPVAPMPIMQAPASPRPPPLAAAVPMPAPVAAPPASVRPRWLKPADEQTPSPTLDELQELQHSLAGSSSASGDETARLAEQMLLADATRRFLQLRHAAQPDLEELHGLVDLIGPLLDAQLTRGALTRDEALELKAQLLQVQYPQASMQQGELTRWQAAQTPR